ncbi:MAG: hypothetical protein HYX95_00495 [Chloroflexi bacterium]|nr:hypothetical protein [Chloroflexota bacterium]
MRFLVVSRSKFPIPAEIALSVVDATIAWAQKYSASGKIEHIWSFAGMQAGGGIANVESLEELDAILVEFPIGPFSDTQIYPLVNFKDALQRARQAAQRMPAAR